MAHAVFPAPVVHSKQIPKDSVSFHHNVQLEQDLKSTTKLVKLDVIPHQIASTKQITHVYQSQQLVSEMNRIPYVCQRALQLRT
jgi:hypothetical protein